jgi:hypothetical protein
LKNKNGYSKLELFEIRLRVSLKNSEIFLKKVKILSKLVWVAGRELKFDKGKLIFQFGIFLNSL